MTVAINEPGHDPHRPKLPLDLGDARHRLSFQRAGISPED
jgi:hypothetical protein